MPKRLIGLSLLVATSIPCAALAQNSPLVVDRNRLDRGVQAPSPPANDQAALPARAGASLQDAPLVQLRHVEISAVGVRTARLEAAWRPFVGRGLDSATLRQVADAVAGAVRRDGVALYTVVIPEQDFGQGVLRLQLIEGHVEGIVIDGPGKGRDMTLLKSYAARLQAERPLRRVTLERYVSLMRDIPGLNPQVELLQGRTPSGIVVRVTAKPIDTELGLGFSNRGSPLLDRQQIQASATFNSVWRQGDQTTATALASADLKSLRYLALSHSEPLGGDGLRLQVSGAALRTRRSDLPLAGDATTAAVTLSYPLVRSYRDNVYLSGGLDGLNSDNAVFGQTLASERTRVVRASLAYGRQTRRMSGSASIILSGGLSGLGARTNRLLAEAAFRKATVNAGLDHKVGRDFTVRLRAAAQITEDAAPTSEQFALGGDVFGRGFDSAVLIGDRGAAGSAELTWAPNGLPSAIAGSEFYVFGDAGEVRRNARLILAAGRESLSSAGGGMRVTLKPGYTIGIEGGRPIDRPRGISKRWRFGVSLSKSI